LPQAQSLISSREWCLIKKGLQAQQGAITPALQAPLGTIIALAQALQPQPDAPARAEHLQSFRAAGEQLLAVIDDMLQAASAETQPMPATESPTP